MEKEKAIEILENYIQSTRMPIEISKAIKTLIAVTRKHGAGHDRDEIALVALRSLIDTDDYGASWARHIAERAYLIADAMLKERKNELRKS